VININKKITKTRIAIRILPAMKNELYHLCVDENKTISRKVVELISDELENKKIYKKRI